MYDHIMTEKNTGTYSGDPISDLAEILYDKLEWLDPADAPNWGDLSERDKEIYVSAIETIVRHHEAVLAAVRLTSLP